MTKLSALILSSLLALSCQSQPSRDEYCDRSPSSVGQCHLLFSKEGSGNEFFAGELSKKILALSERDLTEFFENLSDYGVTFEKMIDAIETPYRDAERTEEGKKIYLGKILLERRNQGETTAVILTELGWREEIGYLMPPRDLGTLLKRTYLRLLEEAKANDVPESEIILPAFPFRKDNETRYIRIGIDRPLPKNEGWRIVSVGEIENFDSLILQGKMVVDPYMFFHDWGSHIVDFIERPRYMPAFRKYLLQKERSAWPEGKGKREYLIRRPERLKRYGQIELREGFERYLNELLFLPSEKRNPQIQAILMPSRGEKTLEEVRDKYFSMDQASLLRTAERYLHHQSTLFSRHGGGARDFNYERYSTIENNLLAIDEMLDGKSKYRHERDAPPDGKTDQAYKRHELPGIFECLDYLVKELKGTSEQTRVSKKISDLANQHRASTEENFSFRLLSLHLAEIEYRIRTALALKISPEQIASDLAVLYTLDGWKTYRHSPTYQYYEATSMPNSVQWYFMVDVARPVQ